MISLQSPSQLYQQDSASISRFVIAQGRGQSFPPSTTFPVQLNDDLYRQFLSNVDPISRVPLVRRPTVETLERLVAQRRGGGGEVQQFLSEQQGQSDHDTNSKDSDKDDRKLPAMTPSNKSTPK